jgi:DNA-directed RNA polymerase subunit RPC12/RpoP
MVPDETNKLAAHLNRIKALTEKLRFAQDACAEGKRIAERLEREADGAHQTLQAAQQSGHDPQRAGDVRCAACGSRLVPPQMATGFTLPPRTDYACIKCGRAYVVAGDPPRLVSMFLKDARPSCDT